MPFTDSIKMVDVVIAEKSLLSATPSDVAAGKEFIGTTQHIESGAIPVLETHTSDIQISAGEIYNVAYGINKLAYSVKAKSLEEETPGTALGTDILEGKTAWINGYKITGTMPNNGAVQANLSAGDAFEIPNGYHQNGLITVKSLAEQTVSNAVSDDVLSGKITWANGNMLEGSMTNNGSVVKTLTSGENFTIPKGYHDGRGIISAPTVGSQTPGDATAQEIVQDKIAWVNGEKIVGTMPFNEAETIMLPMNGEYEIPNGYHTGFGVIRQNVPSKEGQVIGPTKESQTLEVAGFYMTSDITITGVDALNYRRNLGVVKDSTGEEILNKTLIVSNNQSSIAIYVDDWHDGSTYNNYDISFSDLVDKNGNPVTLSIQSVFDWEAESKIYNFNGIEISISVDADTNGQIINISGINAGKITINEPFASREFGI